MVVYKLTDREGYTRRDLNQVCWLQHRTKKTAMKTVGTGPLCTDHWLHAYEHPVLAILHDPNHANLNYNDEARLWVCETDNGTIRRDSMLKLGTSSLRVLHEMKKPKISIQQHVAYAIHCTLRVFAEEKYVTWAHRWLADIDRSWSAIQKVYSPCSAGTFPHKSIESESAYEALETAQYYCPKCTITFSSAARTARIASFEYAEAEKKHLDLVDCAREAGIL